MSDDNLINLTIAIYDIRKLVRSPNYPQHAAYALILLANIGRSERGYADCTDCSCAIGPEHNDPQMVAIIELGIQVSGALLCEACSAKPEAANNLKNKLVKLFNAEGCSIFPGVVGHA